MTSKQLLTVQSYLKHFSNLNTQGIVSLLADNFNYQLAPASLSPPGPFDKQTYPDHVKFIRSLATSWPVTPKEYFTTEGSNIVTVWTSAKMAVRDDVKDNDAPPEFWDIEGEYFFIFTLDQTGEKISRIVEILDGKVTVDKVYPLIERAMGNTKKREAERGN